QTGAQEGVAQPIETTSAPETEAAGTTDPLGVGETAAPVLAPVSSGFGLREHPIEGSEKFHNGLDLAADYGSAIGAFADGVVDYIGESPAYGQYLQLIHANGVTSFYAHCSRLCVQPGQQVTAGEKVAEVGDTGEVTGAHLHFELKVDGTPVDPADYIEVE
ncbi:MAG TPA: M23 family metallopeptidase, partial [Candidatus Intestinimonas stercorigallinarum]|nr:M23 family metallopeptidase [Candidatus Intestinimonas stercorigallinarum]